MKFRFCGEADCPDWLLAEIYTLSRLSSIKLKLLAQIVVQGIIKPPVDINKAEQLFSDSKLDVDIDLKACVACLSFIITSAVRFNCNSSALHSELQQLGLPREHSTSVKRVVDEHSEELTSHFKKQSLRVNQLDNITAEVDNTTNCVSLELVINGDSHKVTMVPFTANVLLENLKKVRETMVQLKDPVVFI
ncbi:COMM domain-containing protein 4 [Tribolium castaneum]|uniref:COMM domain-containing protein 4-like Protein n=1 Tax=Tribolium castaneum TaxID=7070 RepID=D6W6Z5_TRICA|nr:PREDICTED: COMM domain-containing protein 4 isoform X1 [Tribolium castaneum]XP_015836907.1 PREDICTED: COMM domain-containing protein 4 isoform X2 [Tribolium castaneum]EFA11486.2 COMM domain-containing protein 4-like Protein [Tribolium castaneum]|eukprot:XP_008193412.1 PREDICTED: COMM domain-containing protein 4 isoform X1 [Tribolium castaneum]